MPVKKIEKWIVCGRRVYVNDEGYCKRCNKNRQQTK